MPCVNAGMSHELQASGCVIQRLPVQTASTMRLTAGVCMPEQRRNSARSSTRRSIFVFCASSRSVLVRFGVGVRFGALGRLNIGIVAARWWIGWSAVLQGRPH